MLLKLFIGNRIREIKNLFLVLFWSYCLINDNFVDLFIRGISVIELYVLILWKYGLYWLLFEL